MSISTLVSFAPCCVFVSLLCRSTPVEVLHTMLLGCYKYLLRKKMSRLSSVQRDELSARIAAFSLSGLDKRLS